MQTGHRREGNRAREQTNRRIYADILEQIVTGKLSPGERLKEEELAEKYDVSRTPIREILIALEKDGLVERTPNRGAKVMRFTPDDLEQVYDVRGALECLAVRRAIAYIPLNDLSKFERRLEALENRQEPTLNQRRAELDLELHRFIASHSRNRRLVADLENISLLLNSLRLISYRNDEHTHRAGQQHLAIIRALQRRDVQLAERLMAEHIETSKRNMLELLFHRHEAGEELTFAVSSAGR